MSMYGAPYLGDKQQRKPSDPRASGVPATPRPSMVDEVLKPGDSGAAEEYVRT